jgi:hypothetical protein
MNNQTKINTLTEMVENSQLTPRQKDLYFKLFKEIISDFNIQELKLKNLVAKKYLNSHYSDIEKFDFDFDMIFCAMDTLGLSPIEILLKPTEIILWANKNIPTAEKIKMTAERYFDMINKVNYFNVITGRLPENISELVEYYKNNTGIEL